MNASIAVASASDSGIRVQDVKFCYEHSTVPALDGVSLTIAPGQIFGLLGPNGAGKSTLLGLLSGSLALQGGSISILGEPLPRRGKHIKRMSAIVPQEYAFYESLSGRQNLDYFGRVFGLDRALRAQRIAHAVDVCRLQEFLQRPAGSYSGGLKRRLNLAIGLLNAPRVLYLDEPTVGIDAESRRFILDAVHSLRASGTTIVYTSHYMEEVEQLCDAVAIIDHGRVVVEERMENLLRREGNQLLQLTLRAANPAVEAVLAAFQATHVDARIWTLAVPPERLASLLAEVAKSGAEIERAQYGISRLEKIYLGLLLGSQPPGAEA